MRYHDKSLKTVRDVRNAAEKFLPRGSNRFYQNGLTYLGAVDGLPLGRKAPMPEKLVSALSNLEDVLVVGVVESWSTVGPEGPDAREARVGSVEFRRCISGWSR